MLIFTHTYAAPISINDIAWAARWEADSFAIETTDGGTTRVSAWGDLSGNARHAIQSTHSKRPILVPNAKNGRAAIDFSAVGCEGLLFPEFATSGAFTRIVVVKSNATLSRYWGYSLSGNHNEGRGGNSEPGNAFFRFVSGGASSATTWEVGSNWTIITTQRDAADMSKSAFGTAALEDKGPMSGVATVDTLGYSANNGQRWIGQIAAAYIAPSALTSDELAAVRAELTTRYAL